MVTSRIFDCGESVCANHYHEALGGKGASSAIATYRTCQKSHSARETLPGDSLIVATEQVTVRTGDDIQVKVIGVVGDDRYVPNISSSISFVMVDDHTRENRCLFTPGARATWRKAYFINAKQLGGGTQPDMVVSQMGIGKDVIETSLYRCLTDLLVNEREAAITSGSDIDDVNTKTWLTIADEFLSLGVSNVVITLLSSSDTLTGAYASDYKRKEGDGGWDIRNAVVRANKAAAIKGQSLGAQEIIPWSEDIGSFDAPLKELDFQWSKAPRGPGGGA
ncbi:Cell cycle serine/threonine-protein kinase hsk1 [Fusarium oxysporum f. sp. albedinis]|nr:Cell cycle serine/threonine-protein kinase hsk1 [Fusarium oxysporum f. sp. albedinis]